MATGEARRSGYVPGQAPPKSLPEPDGDYTLSLAAFASEAEVGWKRKEANKFPSLRTAWAIQGTEDEVTGGEKKVSEFITLHPKAFFKINSLAYAAGYPEEIPGPTYGEDDFDSEDIQRLAGDVDKLLAYIKDNGMEMRASLKTEEYNGYKNNRISTWLPPAEGEAATSTAAEETETESVQAEEEAPKKPVKAAVTKKAAPVAAKKAVAPAKNGKKK